MRYPTTYRSAIRNHNIRRMPWPAPRVAAVRLPKVRGDDRRLLTLPRREKVPIGRVKKGAS
jgi:hypothetical protein